MRFPSSWRILGVGVVVAVLAAVPLVASADSDRRPVPDRPFGQATLTGFASLPQGFSGAIRRLDGSFDVLSDNGYGSRPNSADAILRIQRIKPNLRTGQVQVVGGFNLSDPDRHVPFALHRPDRQLTGTDFDPESIIRARDGSYWIGDEFGPFLLHVDRAGKLLAPPIPMPDVFAPEYGGDRANLSGSKGLESLAISPDRRRAYPLLEGTVRGDTPGSLRIYEFDLRTGTYTTNRWRYQLDAPTGLAVADAISIDDNRFLVIERDGGQGPTATIKKI